MKKTVLLALCASSLSLGACSLEVPDLNNPGLDSFTENPTPPAIYAASTGLLIGNRAGYAAQSGYVAHTGVLGRESFTFDTADLRYVSEMVYGKELNGGSPAFGGSNWNNPYGNIRNSNTLLAALDKVTAPMPDTEKEAIRGLAKTIQALDFLIIINTRDTNGAPIDVGGDIAELGPIVSKEEVFAHIVKLLEEAKGHLEAGGTAFPFGLSQGYTNFNAKDPNPRFDKPATFLRFNRALLARVEVYRGNYATALTALEGSFLDKAQPLSLGVYHSYSTGSGDLPNGLVSTNIYANPALVRDAEHKPNGDVDDRVTRKTKAAKAEKKIDEELRSNLVFTLYPDESSPVPIIRNEELILLRAEANIGLNTAESISKAADDINFIRTTSGGLAARTDLDASNILDELLKQKRYSLLFEGGHRWIDLRRYGKLDILKEEPHLKDGVIHSSFPIPSPELDARK